MLEPRIQENGNQYMIVVDEGITKVYRFSPKGTYKNIWENLIIARDLHAKEIKKAGFFRTEVKDIDNLKQFAEANGYGLAIEG